MLCTKKTGRDKIIIYVFFFLSYNDLERYIDSDSLDEFSIHIDHFRRKKKIHKEIN